MDHWGVKRNYILRFHSRPMKGFLTPLYINALEQINDMPLRNLRVAQRLFQDGAAFSAEYLRTSPALAHRVMAKPWTCVTLLMCDWARPDSSGELGLRGRVEDSPSPTPHTAHEYASTQLAIHGTCVSLHGA